MTKHCDTCACGETDNDRRQALRMAYERGRHDMFTEQSLGLWDDEGSGA